MYDLDMPGCLQVHNDMFRLAYHFLQCFIESSCHCNDACPFAVIQEKVGQASLDLERKGLKASEKSDHNVHKAYDNTADALHDLKGDAKGKAHEAKGNVKEASHKAEAKADKQDGKGCVIM